MGVLKGPFITHSTERPVEDSHCVVFCAAGQPKMQNGCCAAGLENLVADEELRGRAREQSQAGAGAGRTRSPAP
jgi:hypothetical protein